jgi:tetratricopeptide (TPR) repeat protein
MDNSSLQYNLGVVYFRLGQYGLARRAFSRLLSGPDATLARYNLGLIALADGNLRSAKKAFRTVAKDDQTGTLAQRAKRQLNEIGGPPQPESERQWWAILSLGSGYDGNIALRESSASSTENGYFTEGFLAGSG